MIQKDDLKELIKNYFPEGSEKQISTLLEDLSSELEVIAHAKIRENVNFERIKRLNT